VASPPANSRHGWIVAGGGGADRSICPVDGRSYAAGMISAVFAGTARRPRWVLGGAVALAGVLVGVQLLSAPDSGIRFAIPVLLSLLALTALHGRAAGRFSHPLACA
jgi:hypothetical protein